MFILRNETIRLEQVKVNRPTFKTREDWLQAGIEALRPKLKAAGATLPRRLEAIVSWPKGSSTAIGQCFSKTWTKSGRVYVAVSPTLGADRARVLDVLLHELIHACGILNHGPHFKKIALAVGLTGAMTATTATPELAKELTALARRLGRYPHHVMADFVGGGELPRNPGHMTPGTPKKQKPGQYMLASPVDPAYHVWVSPFQFERHGAPLCPISKQPMVRIR